MLALLRTTVLLTLVQHGRGLGHRPSLPRSLAVFRTYSTSVLSGDRSRCACRMPCHRGRPWFDEAQWSKCNHPVTERTFDLGCLANGRRTWRENPYRGDASAYPIQLPDLVRPRVKVENRAILVWTAQA